MRRLLIPFVVSVLCAAALPVFAQQGTSEIGGKVTDDQGGVLPGVSIVLTNVNTGAFREVTSGADGSYFASQLTPGTYKLAAKLTSFRPFERGGLQLAVGKTLTINVTLALGALEETVRVTAESPLVDTTSVKVGGNIGTIELSELPAMNRNFFATVALVPGIQFTPSNQMGNDTIVAAGQTSQNNNVAVDGGYNADDALGTSAGAQVRTPLEAIQEFQVLTSMYDAEFGRASGAIVNAITKAGTNEFKGVLFGEAASNRLTAADYFVRTQGLEKPTAVRRDWGGVIGGPIVKNKAQFFFSLERQVDNPNRTRVFPTRPSLNFSIAEDRTDWNTLIRFDHQVNANNTWAVRWLREWAPQWYTIGTRQTLESFQDETDLDQTAVGTLTSVLGNARVNTVRVARTWEHWWHGNACFRTQGSKGGQEGFIFKQEAQGNQALCPPQLDYLSFLAHASTESQVPWDSNYQSEDDHWSRDSLRSRDHPARRDRQPVVFSRQQLSGRQKQLRAAPELHPHARRGRQVAGARRIRDLLQPLDPGRRRRHAGIRQVHLVRRRQLPDQRRRPESVRGTTANRSVPRERPGREPRTPQPVLPAGRAGEERRRRDLRLAESETAVRASVHDRLCPGDRGGARGPCRLHSDGEQGHVPGAQPNPGAACDHEPHRSKHHTVGCLWRAGRAVQTAGLADGEHRRVDVRRAEPFARKALRQQLVGQSLVLAVVVERHGGEPGR